MARAAAEEGDDGAELATVSELHVEDATEIPTLDPAALAHFAAIQGTLTFREGMLARALAAELSPADLRAWLAELRTMSVPEAVAKIRSVLEPDAGSTPAGGVS